MRLSDEKSVPAFSLVHVAEGKNILALFLVHDAGEKRMHEPGFGKLGCSRMRL